jgi:cytochrome oxidase Cu insertion factor (SCO1/SenC/PrrC family)
MSAENPIDPVEQRKSRRTLLLVAAVCLAPFVGSILLYWFWQPSSRINYGELLDGIAAPTGALAPHAGDKPFEFGQLKGKWIFVTVDSGACDDYCRKKLWKMRQVRLTQGKYPERIERVWLTTDAQPVSAVVLKEYEGTWIARAPDSLAKSFPYLQVQRDHIYLVDPLGNVVLRYPKDADPSRMKKDITRLLRVSRIG